jgi:hypothetical protein
MPLSAAALGVGGAAIAADIKFVQLHSAAPTNGVGSETGTRTACTVNSDASGNLSLGSAVAFTGITASGAVKYVSAWSASTGGTFLGQWALTGDQAANAAGQYTLDTLGNTVSAS